MLPTPPPPPPSGPQVYHNLDDFEGLIAGHGQPVELATALGCPCRDATTGSAQQTCSSCLGMGYLFPLVHNTLAVLQQLGATRKAYNWAEATLGTVSISITNADKLGHMDRLTLLKAETTYQQQATIYAPIAPGDPALTVLVYPPLTIEHAYTWNPATHQAEPLPDGAILAQTERVLALDPALAGRQLAIRYRHRPVYHIVEIPRDIMTAPSDPTAKLRSFPLHAIGRRAHLLIGPTTPNYPIG
jgi:hypothetical protein